MRYPCSGGFPAGAGTAPARPGPVRHPPDRAPASVADRWWRPFRKVGNAAVTYVDLSPHAAREADAVGRLDPEEHSRWLRFQHPGPRRRFALCRAALRALLCDRLGCANGDLAFAVTRHGKPFAVVDGTPAAIGFNVSHGGRHGLIAVAPKGRLGVDVEERASRRDLDGLIDTAFAPGEQADLAAAPGSGRLHMFYHIWTMKEALLKALGTGLTRDMSGFEIPADLRRGTTTEPFRFPWIPEVGWRLADLGNQEFAAALAHELAPDEEGMSQGGPAA